MPTSESEQYTEVELRGTLVALADRDEPNLDAFRARLATAGDTDLESVDEVIEIAPTHHASGTRSLPRSRFVRTKTFAIAACVAAVLLVAGIAVGLTHGSSSHSPADPGVSIPAPRPQLPGSVILEQYSGTGSRSFVLTRYRVAVHEELAVDMNCRGPGRVRVSTSLVMTKCGRGFTGGASFPTSTRTLRVTAQPNTSWRMILVLEPTLRTNGGVQEPIDPDFRHPDPQYELGRGSGQGDGDVDISATTSDDYPQILLTCRGTGLRITSDTPGFHAFYTHTCFVGSEYVFDLKHATLPATLHVSASAGTMWRLIGR